MSHESPHHPAADARCPLSSAFNPLPLRALPSPLPLMLPLPLPTPTPTPSTHSPPAPTRPAHQHPRGPQPPLEQPPPPGLRRRGLSHLLSLPLPVIFSSALSSSPAPGCDLLCSRLRTPTSSLSLLIQTRPSTISSLVASPGTATPSLIVCCSVSHSHALFSSLAVALARARPAAAKDFMFFPAPVDCFLPHVKHGTLVLSLVMKPPATLSRSPNPSGRSTIDSNM